MCAVHLGCSVHLGDVISALGFFIALGDIISVFGVYNALRALKDPALKVMHLKANVFCLEKNRGTQLNISFRTFGIKFEIFT